MKFRFDANQEYQLDAIAAVVDLFDGQPRTDVDLSLLASGPVPALPNRLDLDEPALLLNLRGVQERNGLPPDEGLVMIAHAADMAAGETTVRFPNFSVEMETGTGKTYVYLRTALELYERYGMRKFIVVVPSVAIREGVLKTLQITAEHFRTLYSNPPYRYYVYDSANLSQVRQFALSNGIEIMVMTLASFNKAANVIKQSTDRLQGETPIHLVQATRPVLILDEPQNMESDTSTAALAALNPLCALRYSATHRNPYNLIYRLTPFEAYRQGLVKRIEVAGIEEVDNANQPFIRLDGLQTQKKTVTAALTVHQLLKSGAIRQKAVRVTPGDRLEVKANRDEYTDFVVDEINPGGGFLRFTNGLELRTGERTGANTEAVWEAQIRYTIQEHFIKQRRLRERGIKVLSLFFIDRVDNYVTNEAPIRRLFARCFDELKAGYPDWQDTNPAEVQAGYFAQRRTRSGAVVYEDSSTGEAEKDRAVYDLIMKDKERLLSFAEPVAFIFSHSALREGWDNPNVFQICTLNQTTSEIKKRQEIGRGVRLAVDQTGERVREEQVNVLTVMANESYEEYVARLQSEYAEDYGPGERPPDPPNARQDVTVRQNKQRFLSEAFKALWERIKYKTRYAVEIDSDRLVADVLHDLDRTAIPAPRISVTKAQVQVGTDDTLTALQVSAAKTVVDLADRYPLPNLVALMEDLLERTTPPARLSRKTLLEIYRRAIDRQAAIDNPHGWANIAVQIIKRKLADQLVDGIRYERIDEWYEMTRFETEMDIWEKYLEPAPHSIYDYVKVDSEPERAFVRSMEQREDVKLYVKLPSWFTVETPIGAYNPDWAIVIEPRDEHGQPIGDEMIYLVHETKGTTKLDDLRPDEARKVRCGEHHFRDALDVSYSVGPELPPQV